MTDGFLTLFGENYIAKNLLKDRCEKIFHIKINKNYYYSSIMAFFRFNIQKYILYIIGFNSPLISFLT